MKLRYIANIRFPTEKAHGIQIMEMCGAFAEAGAEVELIVPEGKSDTNEDPWSYYGVKRNFSIRKLKITNYTHLGYIFGALVYHIERLSFAWEALKDTMSHPADIYYHRDGLTFIRFSRKGLPSVFEVHELPRKFFLYRKAMLQSKKIITITKKLKDYLIALGVPETKILVAPDGADIASFNVSETKEEARVKLNLGLDDSIILYTGQLFQWKGVETLIQAGSGLPIGTRIIIVGGDIARIKFLKEMVRKFNSPCIFIGQVFYREIPRYLRAADIAVIPNSGKKAIGLEYTSPLKLFEALAAGKAIVASDLPSLREILDENTAMFFKADDSRSLHETLALLLPDKKRQKELGARALVLSKEFDWQMRVKKILKSIS